MAPRGLRRLRNAQDLRAELAKRVAVSFARVKASKEAWKTVLVDASDSSSSESDAESVAT